MEFDFSNRDLMEGHLVDLVSRIWGKDCTLWPGPAENTRDHLGWLEAPNETKNNLDMLMGIVRSIDTAAIETVVLLGMGGSSLGAKAFLDVLPRDSRLRVLVIDTIEEDFIVEVLSSLDPCRSMFLVSSKSGKTLETMCLYRFFRGWASEYIEDTELGSRFIAITDQGSPLDALAQRDSFAEILYGNPQIGGRYSGLSLQGVFPALLSGIDISHVLQSGIDMSRGSRSASISENKSLALAMFLVSNFVRGKDKLTLLTSGVVDGFSPWIEQLVAESLGKDGKGIVPVVGEPIYELSQYSTDRMFVYITCSDAENSKEDSDLIDSLGKMGAGVFKIEMPSLYDLGGEMFRWEFAMALVASVLSINPFDQPDVDKSKVIDIDDIVSLTKPDRVKYIDVNQPMNELFSFIKDGMYLAILAYVPLRDDIKYLLQDFRSSITTGFGIPTTLGFGPQYLHSTGQIHKGGANNGVYLQIVCDSKGSLCDTALEESFSTIWRAQANGDMDALRNIGREIVQVDLKNNLVEGLHMLIRQVEKTN